MRKATIHLGLPGFDAYEARDLDVSNVSYTTTVQPIHFNDFWGASISNALTQCGINSGSVTFHQWERHILDHIGGKCLAFLE